MSSKCLQIKFCRTMFLFFFRIKLEGQDTKLLTIKANLVDQGLQILSLQTEAHISCIGFGNTYYGSDKTECALLYNNGPEPINFVAILDEDAIAQEMVRFCLNYYIF